jgi:E3 ubiquitin-protein ligase BRE1
MTTAQIVSSLIPPSDTIVKMEDRKRSLANDVDDLAPSRKRMVKDENGQQMRMDAEKEKEIEVCIILSFITCLQWLIALCE